jgi:hypothetical protein
MTTAIAGDWIAQDKTLWRELLDKWADRTGFEAPSAGLIFVEPAKSTTGQAAYWIAAVPTTTVVGEGYATAGDAPDREILVAALIYMQPGSVPPADWEKDLIADFETVIAAASARSGWSKYVLRHPTPITPSPYQGQALWTLEGIQFRVKVG